MDKTKRGSDGHQDSETIVAVVHTNAGALLELDAERRETGSREDAEIVVGAVDDEARQLLDFFDVFQTVLQLGRCTMDALNCTLER